MARTKKTTLPPLTTSEARTALLEAGVAVAPKGRLSADARAQAEKITGRKFE